MKFLVARCLGDELCVEKVFHCALSEDGNVAWMEMCTCSGERTYVQNIEIVEVAAKAIYDFLDGTNNFFWFSPERMDRRRKQIEIIDKMKEVMGI